jgi:protein-S-isoprenylcysteine O-methyltransferase Ste14
LVAWINFAVLIFASLFFLYFYLLSVAPAALEKLIGLQAYNKCYRYRVIAIFFEMITLVNYVVYYFLPLPTPLPRNFPWSYWISATIAVLILIPMGSLMVIGMLQAGEEATRPRKEHEMYAGIYKKIRHPQATGEVFLWLGFAFLLNSPFLALFSFVYFPIFLIMCWAEERDLILRLGDAYIEYYRKTNAFIPKL